MTGQAGPLADRPVLDHLALASHRAWDNLERYGRQLGARWLGGPHPGDGSGTDSGEEPAFYFCQVGFANGTKLEFIEPNDTPGSDFIRRFLHRNGPGPHHLTFKVTDIDAAIGRAEAAGYSIVGASLDDPDWKEAFLHPKESHGIVVQLAQPGPDAGWPDPAPLPPTEQGHTTTLDRVTHCVADLDRATALFTEVLGMTPVEEPVDQRMGPRRALRSGPWELCLLQPTLDGPRDWLGDRPGRVLQLSMTAADPSAVDGVRRQHDVWYLAPEYNLGTRVLIRAADPATSPDTASLDTTSPEED